MIILQFAQFICNLLPEMPEVDEYNKADFIISEDEELVIWEVKL